MNSSSLELQLSSALRRLAALKRQAGSKAVPDKILASALEELENALEELRVSHEMLLESRTRMDTLQQELRQQYERYWQLFDDMPEAYVLTKPDSTILEVNKAAAELLNVSQRFLVGKTLSVFVCEDRAGFLTETDRAAAQNSPVEMRLRIRPRERHPIDVSVTVRGDATQLRWLFRCTPEVV